MVAKLGGLVKSGSTFSGYGISVLIVLGFMGVRLALGAWLGHDATYLLLGGASMLSAWIGGLGPGLLATVLAAIMTNLAFIPPIARSCSHPRRSPRSCCSFWEGE